MFALLILFDVVTTVADDWNARERDGRKNAIVDKHAVANDRILLVDDKVMILFDFLTLNNV